MPDESRWKYATRLTVAAVLLAAAAQFAWQTVNELETRRRMRTELAEISHVKYGLLNADRWVEKLIPILEAQIDSLDLKAANQASLRPFVEKALYRLLDDVKDKMSKPDPNAKGGLGGLMGTGGAMVANMMIGALRPHVPEYTDVVLAELGKPETKTAVKNYIKGVLMNGAKNTFGSVDMRYYNYLLKQYGCANGPACQAELGRRVQVLDGHIIPHALTVLAACALGFLVLTIATPVLGRLAVVVLLLFCIVLLVSGLLTPMLEVEAKITRLNLTLMGTPISFDDQVMYFQSKSVLEVFRALIDTGKLDMEVVGVLVLMFSVIFPILKILTSSLCLWIPSLPSRSRIARFFALESSKWSMADVMALAIFMSYVAFNGLVSNTMNGLLATGADLRIPTDSSKLLAGYYLFIGFCLASLFLAKKLERGIRTASAAAEAQ